MIVYMVVLIVCWFEDVFEVFLIECWFEDAHLTASVRLWCGAVGMSKNETLG